MAKKARRLRRMRISEISLVDRPANEREFDFVKRYDGAEDFDLDYARQLEAVRNGQGSHYSTAGHNADEYADNVEREVNIDGLGKDLADAMGDALHPDVPYPTPARHFGRELAQAAAEAIEDVRLWTGQQPDPEKAAEVIAAAVGAVLEQVDEE